MKVYMHSTSAIDKDPRPKRIMDFLQGEKHQVHDLQYIYSKRSKIIKFIMYIFWLISKRNYFLIKIISLQPSQRLDRNQVDYHLVEDPLILPFLFDKMDESAKVVIDLREFHPRAQSNFVFYFTYRLIYTHIYRNYVTQANYVLTVSEMHKNICEKKFRIKSEVVLSAPVYSHDKNNFIEKRKQKIDYVYLGLANKNRGMSLICDSFVKLKDSNLHLYLSGNVIYIEKLQAKYAKIKNIKILRMVELTEVITELRKYDVGICFFKKPWNTKHALPNKFFSYIHSDLALLVYEKSQMGNLVNKHGIGKTIGKYSVRSFCEVVSNLTFEEVNRYRKQSNNLKASLCFQNEASVLRGIFK
jgi:hypothetical protein